MIPISLKIKLHESGDGSFSISKMGTISDIIKRNSSRFYLFNNFKSIHMKKIILLVAVSAFSLCLYAQDRSADTTTRHHMGKMDKMNKMKDCVVMENGNMMVMKNGETTPMSQDMTMTNGTVVMTNGSVKMKDGKTMQLKNDECVYMDGHMGHVKHPTWRKVQAR